MTVLDLIPIMLILFVSALGVIVADKVLTDVKNTWTPSSTSGQDIINKNTIRPMNAGFLILTVGLGISTIIGAFMIRSHPIFFFISVFILGFVLLLSPQISNAWTTFIGNTQVATTGNNFPIIVAIMDNLPKILLGFGVVIMVAMYGKMRSNY